MVLNLMAWIGGGTAKARFLRFLLKGGLRMRTLVDGDDLVAQRVRRRHCGGCEGVGDEVIGGNAGWREDAGRDVSVWGPSPSVMRVSELYHCRRKGQRWIQDPPGPTYVLSCARVGRLNSSFPPAASPPITARHPRIGGSRPSTSRRI